MNERSAESRERDGSEPLEAWAPIDLLLEQGSQSELDAMRSEVGADAMLALEMADTVDLLDRMRQATVEPSQQFAFRMREVVARAARRSSLRQPSHGQPSYGQKGPGWGRRLMPLIAVISAAATFAGLWLLDPLHREQRQRKCVVVSSQLPDAAPMPMLRPVVSEVLDVHQAAWLESVELMRRRLDQEAAPRLREAFERGLQEPSDPLAQWLGPHNAMMLLRIDHDLRASAAVREAALRRHGSLKAVDDRVQQLADELADALLAPPRLLAEAPLEDHVSTCAYAVRALIAAGSTPARSAALQRGGKQLAEHLPRLHGAVLAVGLSALMELSAVTGDYHQLVAGAGSRLVDEVLHTDDETWGRSRPDLLSARVSAAALGEAGRVLQWLPAYGVDGARCGLVRNLVLGQLRDLCDRGQERPEVLAAMLYGVGDLMAADDRERVQFSLRRWKLVRLAPDFVTVQQMAWGRRPGDFGFTRMQGELRQTSVLPLPTSLLERAAFCLCLSTNFAGYVGDLCSGSTERGS